MEKWPEAEPRMGIKGASLCGEPSFLSTNLLRWASLSNLTEVGTQDPHGGQPSPEHRPAPWQEATKPAGHPQPT